MVDHEAATEFAEFVNTKSRERHLKNLAAAYADLRARVADQDAWIAQYNENSDLIGEALDRIREKRPTGEPARSDWREVRDLVARVEALEISGEVEEVAA